MPSKGALGLVCALLPAWLLVGCATGIPAAIREAPAANPRVGEVQDDPERWIGARVRWGGTILAVNNRERLTEIEVLARPLDAYGEPDGNARGEGRFIAVVGRFIDPAEYPEKQLLTVAGLLERLETRRVGEYPYDYPVVAVDVLYLWPEPLPPVYPYPYPWYDPWLGPWPGPWFDPWYRPWPTYHR
jgi:outer membrane lipoprotein